jgi:hypothetical protein
VVTRASVGKQELADRLALRSGFTKTSAVDTVNFLLDTIRDEVRDAGAPLLCLLSFFLPIKSFGRFYFVLCVLLQIC